MVKIKFAVGLVSYFQEHGFDTADWRKSVDGTTTIVHLEFAQTLIPNIESDSNITIYYCPSDELNNLLNSSAWNNPQ